jgi:transposase InsO family protein
VFEWAFLAASWAELLVVGEQLARFTRRHDLAQSVGRTGACGDNAQADSFWATMKVEFHDRYLWPTRLR